MSEERADTTMQDSAERLRLDLRDTMDLIRRSGGGVVFEEFPGPLREEPTPGAALRGLIDVADALAETLAQLDETAWPPLASLPARTAVTSPDRAAPTQERAALGESNRPTLETVRRLGGP